MSLWTLVKIVAALCVIAIMAFTGMLAYHVAVAPLGGVFSKIVPDPTNIVKDGSDADFAKMIDAGNNLPEIDPGEKAFQKAHELLALGKLADAREKLTSIVNVYPTSAAAPIARSIIGEINLDEILSTSFTQGKHSYAVKKGDSFLGIASQQKTTLENIMYLNSMMDPRSLQPGDELVVMSLDFRILLEPHKKTLTIMDGGRFIREYQLLHTSNISPLPQRTTVSSKFGEKDGKRVLPSSHDYTASSKVIQISKPSLQIRAGEENGEIKSMSGIRLRPEDMEELSLLIRVGNEVEIR